MHSKIKFQRMEVETSEFYLNKSVKLEENQEIALSLETNFNKEDCDALSLSLDLSIFNKDFKEKEKPLHIRLVINTFFEINEELDEENLIKKYGANMILLSYPYARSYITNLTAMANIPPINIPIISIEDVLGR
ncbi:TPA: protein-export chaperone SecB [Streptococcus suis]|nr:protein-export chaperone SecB [Streptococcus suis]HEM5205506.1 protein-export chaperone SecB [Streptococcus suis]HEM5215996.1 protein-export chaperone SecB [Streptococcus suis]